MDERFFREAGFLLGCAAKPIGYSEVLVQGLSSLLEQNLERQLRIKARRDCSTDKGFACFCFKHQGFCHPFGVLFGERLLLPGAYTPGCDLASLRDYTPVCVLASLRDLITIRSKVKRKAASKRVGSG